MIFMSRLEDFFLACAPGIGYASAYGSQMIRFKLESGFVNAEMRVTYDVWQQTIAWCKENNVLDLQHEGVVGPTRDVMCSTLDEDTYYFLRWLIFLEQFFERHGPEPEVPPEVELQQTSIGLLVNNTGGWEIMHKNMKANIFAGVWAARFIYGRRARHYVKKGWTNPDAKMFYECMDYVCTFDKDQRLKGMDNIRMLYEAVRDSGAVLIEEDEQIRKFVGKFFELLLENRVKFRLAVHRSRPYFKAEYERNRDPAVRLKEIKESNMCPPHLREEKKD